MLRDMTSPLLLAAARARVEAMEHLDKAAELIRILSHGDMRVGMRSALASVMTAKRRLTKTWPIAVRKNRRRTSRRTSRR